MGIFNRDKVSIEVKWMRARIKNGEDIEAQQSDGSPLMIAARCGHPNSIKFLLKKGAKVDARQKESGRTALMFAASGWEKSSLECVKLLIKNGADVNARTDYGETPLIHAADSLEQFPEMTSLLLEKGANPNLRGAGGQTAIFWAVAKGYVATVALLLEAGADSDLKDDRGTTAISYSTNLEIIKQFEKAKARVEQIALAKRDGVEEIIDALNEDSEKRR